MRTFAAHVLLASSLLACAADRGEDFELPETLVDGAADSWAAPTMFGALHERVWQRGEIDPWSSMRFPAWDFSLDGNASVTIATRQAPSAEPELTRTVVYLYQLRSSGTWQRVAKSAAGQDFGSVTMSLARGNYRVVVKALDGSAQGEFLLQRQCSGAGCADRPQCLVRDNFNDVIGIRNGALRDLGKLELTATSALTAVMAAQIIAAVNESTHEVSTINDAFAAVDFEVVNLHRFWDDLRGRPLVAMEYGAGDNSYGAYFTEHSATVAASIHDGYIENCALVPRACLFGKRMYEAAFMPGMRETASRTLRSSTGVDATTAKQLMRLMQTTTLADAFEGVEDFEVSTLEHADGRKFVEIRYYAGDTPVGAFFRAGTDEVVAENSDGDLYNCTALYE